MPNRVVALEGVKVVAVSCGYRHTAAISENGTLYTFGRGKYGKLGHGDEQPRLVPRRVGGELEGVKVVAVSCGINHTAAVSEEGTLFTWGKNALSGDAFLPVLVNVSFEDSTLFFLLKYSPFMRDRRLQTSTPFMGIDDFSTSGLDFRTGSTLSFHVTSKVNPSHGCARGSRGLYNPMSG